VWVYVGCLLGGWLGGGGVNSTHTNTSPTVIAPLQCTTGTQVRTSPTDHVHSLWRQSECDLLGSTRRYIPASESNESDSDEGSVECTLRYVDIISTVYFSCNINREVRTEVEE